MAKFNLSKKTLNKKKILLAILHHNPKIDLNILLKKLDIKKIDHLFIIVDRKFNVKIKTKINKKIIFRKKSQYAIPLNRNIAITYAIKNDYNILFFLDSDVKTNKKLISNHLKAHYLFPEIVAIGGAVESSSNFSKKFNLWEFFPKRSKLSGFRPKMTGHHQNSWRRRNFVYHQKYRTASSICTCFVDQELVSYIMRCLLHFTKVYLPKRAVIDAPMPTRA